jgi:hypothetical protein
MFSGLYLASRISGLFVKKNKSMTNAICHLSCTDLPSGMLFLNQDNFCAINQECSTVLDI